MSQDSPPRRTFLTHLKLDNYRRFEAIEVNFDPFLTVFVAQNGAGKTAILDAIAVAFRPFIDTIQGRVSSLGFVKTDIRLALAPEGQMVWHPPTSLEATADIDGCTTHWRRVLASAEGKTTTKEAHELDDRARILLQELRDYAARRRTEAPTFPVIVYYGTARLWEGGRFTEGKRKAAEDLNKQVTAYLEALNPASSFAHFVIWFERVIREAQNEQASGVASPYQPTRMLEAVRRATDHLLAHTGWSNLQWDFVSAEVIAVHPTAGRMPVSMLSDGVRNTLAFVADLAHRCVRLNPHFHEEATSKTPGIVLIDEIDMHLHPSWQQTILGSLREVFPLIQFIVTTHSPQVLSTTPAACIRLLEDSDALVPTEQTQGVESATVLAQLMQVDPTPDLPIVHELRNYKALIQQNLGLSERAIQLRAGLDAHFGPAHPLVVDCDRLLRYQAFKSKLPARTPV